MSWEERYLTPNERVILLAHLHLVVLAKSGTWFVAAFLLAALAPAWITGALGLATFTWFGWELIGWYTHRVVVTTHRIVLITGVITRRVASMPLGKVTDMTYKRSVLGRLIGYGGLIIESAGQDQGIDRIDFLRDPDGFYRVVTSLVMNDATDRVGPPRPHAALGPLEQAIDPSASQRPGDPSSDMQTVRGTTLQRHGGIFGRDDDDDDTDPFLIILP